MGGVQLVEVAEHAFVPSAAVVLADWRADVIKVERRVGGGDRARSLRILDQPTQKATASGQATCREGRGRACAPVLPCGRALALELARARDFELRTVSGATYGCFGRR